MRIICISDTHGSEHLLELPKGDILIHSGDFYLEDLNQLEYANRWFKKQPFKYKILIGGNHDRALEYENRHIIQSILKDVIYLENNSCEIEGLKVWGSPYSLPFNDWYFMKPEIELAKIYSKIPKDTDIIISHSPPHGIMDRTANRYNCGSFSLLEKIKEIKPKLVIFGHIHCCRGIYKDSNTIYVNASVLDDNYKLVNEPIVIEI